MILSITHFKLSSGIYRMPFFFLRHFSNSFKKGAIIAVYSLHSRIAFRCVISASAMDLMATYSFVYNLIFCLLAMLIVHTVRAMPIGQLIRKKRIANIINAVSKNLSLRNNTHGNINMHITQSAKSAKNVR